MPRCDDPILSRLGVPGGGSGAFDLATYQAPGNRPAEHAVFAALDGSAGNTHCTRSTRIPCLRHTVHAQLFASRHRRKEPRSIDEHRAPDLRTPDGVTISSLGGSTSSDQWPPHDLHDSCGEPVRSCGGRKLERPMWPRSVALGGVAVTIAIVLASSTAPVHTQAQLSALPVTVEAPPDNPTTRRKWRSAGCSSGIRSCRARRMSRAPPATIPTSGMRRPLDLSIGVNGVGLGTAAPVRAGRPVPFVKRNSQTMLNVAFNGIDVTGATTGRRRRRCSGTCAWKSLEAQALEPIKALEEMRGDVYPEDARCDDRRAGWPRSPSTARCSREASAASRRSRRQPGKALAAFQRSLIANNAPFDRYMRGDTAAMTAVQVRGMERFAADRLRQLPQRADVLRLQGPRAWRAGQPEAGGVGRRRRRRTRFARRRCATWRSPRRTCTAASFGTLDEVVGFYDDVRGRGGRGGRGERNGTRNPNVAQRDLDPLLARLNVGGGRRDLVAFLEALSDPTFDRTIPDAVPAASRSAGESSRSSERRATRSSRQGPPRRAPIATVVCDRTSHLHRAGRSR